MLAVRVLSSRLGLRLREWTDTGPQGGSNMSSSSASASLARGTAFARSRSRGNGLGRETDVDQEAAERSGADGGITAALQREYESRLWRDRRAAGDDAAGEVPYV